MITFPKTFAPVDWEWQQLQEKLHQSHSLASLVLTAWQMGLWLAHALVEHELDQRAQPLEAWGHCPICGHKLHSKGFVHRRILNLVGWVDWERRVGRCPRHCPGSQTVPFDETLQIARYEQTSVELKR